MSNMLAESTRSTAWIAWCIVDHSAETEPATLHWGEIETFPECTIAFDDGPELSVTLAEALRTAPGQEPEKGLLVSGRFLDLTNATAFHKGLTRTAS